MIFDGISFRKTSKYGWRRGDPTRDVNDDGQPVQENYMVIVKIADCRLFTDEKQSRRYDSTLAAQAFPMAYSLTNMGFGKTTTRHGLLIGGRWVENYKYTPVYLVWGARVYVGSIVREVK